MLVTPLVLIQIFSKRMLADWPKCGSDPRDEGHLACLTKYRMVLLTSYMASSEVLHELRSHPGEEWNKM